MNLGRYQLLGKLASGGMAEVFLAKAAGPRGFEKKLVIKRILPHLAEDESFIDMFFNEARLAAQLDHPNIIQIFDFGEADGSFYLAMEYIDGLNLRILLKRLLAAGEQLPVPLCAKIISLACEGLSYAHAFVDPASGEPLNLVHRDISPDNILVSLNGAVKLADFGIAKAANQLHRTQTGVVKGKVAYMAPEQLRNDPLLDARADLFALGVVLYELLTGHRPIEAENETALMLSILNKEPVPVTHYREDVPERVQHILARALARERDARYGDCRQMQLDLERYLRTVEEPVGPVDIARWVARLASSGTAEASKTSNAKLLLETPSAPSLAAPGSTRTAFASPTHPESTTLPVKGTATVAEEQARVEDATRTNPEHSIPASPAPRRWIAGAALGSALLLGLVGHGVQRLTRQEAVPVVSVPPSPGVDTRPPIPPVAPDPGPESQPLETPRTESASGAQATGAKTGDTRSETPVENTPPAPSEPETPSPPAASAVFRVESNEEGSVKVGRTLKGTTPLVVRNMPPGKVTVEVFDKQKGFSQSKTFKLEPGDNGVKHFTIGKERLSFNIHPYAEVFLDGKSLGFTPMDPVELYEGPHTLTLKNAKMNKTVEQAYTARAGRKNVFTYNFNTPP